MSKLPPKLIRYVGGFLFALAFAGLAVLTLRVPERAVGESLTSGSSTPVSSSPVPSAPVTALSPERVAPGSQTPWGRPVFVDSFDGPKLNTTKWYVYDYPNEEKKRVAQNVRVDGKGQLQLVGTYDQKSKAHAGAGLSARFDQKYGRWEVRARADVGRGFAPTILLWPENNHWPDGGEIDLLETPRGDRLKPIAVVHNGPGNKFRTQGYAGNHSDWHTYAVEWFPDRVTFFLDGVEVWNVTDKSLVPTVSKMHLVLQNDPGCGWVQCPDKNTKAETVMHVDWIRVYKAPDSVVS